jgi:hypothetical protein
MRKHRCLIRARQSLAFKETNNNLSRYLNLLH